MDPAFARQAGGSVLTSVLAARMLADVANRWHPLEAQPARWSKGKRQRR
jgi:hypothetical protein